MVYGSRCTVDGHGFKVRSESPHIVWDACRVWCERQGPEAPIAVGLPGPDRIEPSSKLVLVFGLGSWFLVCG